MRFCSCFILCKGIQDSLGFRIPHCGFRIPDSLSVKLGSRIPIVTGTLDSLSRFLDFKVQSSGLHKQNFPGFRILEAKISWIQDSTSKNFLDSGFRKEKFPGCWALAVETYQSNTLHDDFSVHPSH